MKLIFQLAVLSLFLIGCHKPPTDVEIYQQVIGTWKNAPSASDTVTILSEMRSDGSFFSKWLGATNDNEVDGIWKVQDGFMVMTMTNVPSTIARSLGSMVQRYKIVQIDNEKFVSHLEGDTNLFTMTRQ